MSTQPPLRIQINGILLSTLLFECANARFNYEGLILGTIVSRIRSVVDDASDTRVKTVYTTVVIQGVYKLEPNLPKFYNRAGEILEPVLEQYNIPTNLSILGYLKYRRTENHQLSLRDRTVALNLKIYLDRRRALSSSREPISRPNSNPFAQKSPPPPSPKRSEDVEDENPFPISMALLTSKTNESMSTHDYDYTFWTIDDESSFEALPVEISNMIESPQEDYQSFQSNFATGASRHAASIGMLNTIRSVPTSMLVDGHEAMFKDSFETTKSLTKTVLASEQKVKEALREIELLKEQLEHAKLAASTRNTHQKRSSPGKGQNQHQRLQTPELPSRPALVSYNSRGSSGPLPDLLY
ncbi:hypothetical protein BG011_001000 [Mortierella polycephala]|uniref:Uncharacterized protein n=1 Tax=Mortierella polycephala TaxID=41804 RepID=A0A9P6QAI2_9FUNG|nr:hypothetical protein BG011_001000 [Mortierella polycephala]